jgi:hypothetical protein
MQFVLTIGERGHSWAGRPPITSVHENRADAEAELIHYVRQNWDQQMDSDERPQDAEELIEQYFDYVLERYEILEVNAPVAKAAN